MVWAVYVLIPGSPLDTAPDSLHSTSAESEARSTTWEIERRPAPNRHRIERPSVSNSERETRRERSEAERAELEERNRRARRVIDTLREVYDDRNDAAYDGRNVERHAEQAAREHVEQVVETMHRYQKRGDVPVQFDDEDETHSSFDASREMVESLDDSSDTSSSPGLSPDYRLDVGEKVGR